jgi:multimeric flavodoxin WrbA
MKVLGICCSPRKGGNTETLVNEALKGAKQEGAETELYSVSGKHIEPCDGCRACARTGICHIEDDMQDVYKKML